MHPFVIMPEDSIFFLGKLTFLSVLLVWINIYLYLQSIAINERTESVKRTRAPVDSTSWALNSSNQSTDSSETPINLTRRITEGTFLIPEPLAYASLLLPAWQRCLSCLNDGHIEYLKVKYAEDMMNLAKDQNTVYIQPKVCFTLHVLCCSFYPFKFSGNSL